MNCSACGYLNILELVKKNIIQLNVLTVFLYKYISEASRCHMCKQKSEMRSFKFYGIASNSLQAIQFVHEFFTALRKSKKGVSFSQMFIEICQKLIRPSTPWIQSVCQIHVS